MAHTLTEPQKRLIQELLKVGRWNNVQTAIREKLARVERTRLAHECSKLVPSQEQKMADVGIQTDSRGWPEY